MSNIFAVAKKLRKAHPNKSWQQLVQMASKSQNMATRKKRTTGAKKKKVAGVGAVRRRTYSTTKKTTTKRRRSVGNTGGTIGNLLMLTAGVIAGNMLVVPLIDKGTNMLTGQVPGNMQKLAMGAIGIGKVYYGATHFVKQKHPLAKGISLALLNSGVRQVTNLVAPQLSANIGDVSYVSLPDPNIGEIRQMIAGMGEIPYIENNIAGMESNMPNVGFDADSNLYNMPYVPMGG